MPRPRHTTKEWESLLRRIENKGWVVDRNAGYTPDLSR